jgi:hypothetical protein
MEVIQMPIAVSAAVFLGLALVAWRRMPVCARIFLATGSTFVIAAIDQPGLSADQILTQHSNGLAYLVAVARMAGLTAFLVGVVGLVRDGIPLK